MKQRAARIALTVTALLCAPGLAYAQTVPAAKPHVPLEKTIGQAGPPGLVPSLIVMNARGATLEGGKLTLTGVCY